jgi:hypothetical protein
MVRPTTSSQLYRWNQSAEEASAQTTLLSNDRPSILDRLASCLRAYVFHSSCVVLPLPSATIMSGLGRSYADETLLHISTICLF